MRLTLLVVFSAAFGFVMASSGAFDWTGLVLISLGGFLVVGSSNGLNQVIERNYDILMTRTENRPVAAGRMSVNEASIASLLMGIAGVLILGIYFNQLTGILAFTSLALYAFVYTPLKRVHPINVFVGAIPGAMPPMLGWAAVTGSMDAMCIALFLIQFFWQFVHFWSIAWILDEDYKKAGFKMLPTSGRTTATATKIIIYALMLLPLGLLPFQLGKAGMVSTIFAELAAAYMLFRAINLYRTCENKEARQIMFSSYIYLTVMQVAFMTDKI
ncbi:MAG: protoheme IX farnesyltransferase [Flavobacteriaceae bacterium]|nr:protoheme IX farnesyltransferase [Flavobacteriaceae bacterium]